MNFFHYQYAIHHNYTKLTFLNCKEAEDEAHEENAIVKRAKISDYDIRD